MDLSTFNKGAIGFMSHAVQEHIPGHRPPENLGRLYELIHEGKVGRLVVNDSRVVVDFVNQFGSEANRRAFVRTSTKLGESRDPVTAIDRVFFY